MDKMIKAINSTKEYLIIGVVSTDLMKDIVLKQELVNNSINVVSDVVSANILMTNNLKTQGEEIGIVLKSNGILSHVISNGTYDGDFSGYVVLNNDVSNLVIGEGIFEVNKYYNNLEVSNSQVKITSSNISDLVVDYYDQSEQIYTLVILASLSDTTTSQLYASGGIMIQLLPNASDEIIEYIVNAVDNITELSKKIALGMSAIELVQLIDADAVILEEKPIRFNCKCNRDSILESIQNLNSDEIKQIIKEDGELKVICNYCNTAYIYNLDDIE